MQKSQLSLQLSCNGNTLTHNNSTQTFTIESLYEKLREQQVLFLNIVKYRATFAPADLP